MSLVTPGGWRGRRKRDLVGKTYARALETRRSGWHGDPPAILLPLRELVPRFGAFIEAWLHLAEEVESTFRLFFGSLSTDLPLDLHFLLIAQAIEAYQDARFVRRPLAEEEFQQVKVVLLAACPEEHRPWLEKVLA